MRRASSVLSAGSRVCSHKRGSGRKLALAATICDIDGRGFQIESIPLVREGRSGKTLQAWGT